MAAAVTYSNFGGRLVHENRNGTETFYIPDTLDSMAMTLDANGAQTSRTEYWPYGESAATTGFNPSPWSFVGLLAYFSDIVSNMLYIRARTYKSGTAQWLTSDSLWPAEPSYAYSNQPIMITDPSGYQHAGVSGIPGAGIEGTIPGGPGDRYDNNIWGCFWLGWRLWRNPPFDPQPSLNCITLNCAGLSGKDLGECLAACAGDRLKDLPLQKVFCIMYPHYCEQYGSTPCEHVHDMDSCQACADQKYLQCMLKTPPYGWQKCLNVQKAGYLKCLQKYG